MQWQLLNVITVNVISHILCFYLVGPIQEYYLIKVTTYCYHWVYVISLVQTQSDHIKRHLQKNHFVNLSQEGGEFLFLFSSPTIRITKKTITIPIATKGNTTTTTKTITKTTITCQKMEVSFCCCSLLPLFLFFSEQQRV